MANFNYRAKDLEGIEHKGAIDSSDEHSAVALLRKKGLIVISVTPEVTGQGGFVLRFINKVSFNQIVLLTRQLSTMVGAGLSLSDAMDILIEQTDHKVLKKVLEELSEDLKGGLPFHQALARHPDTFPPLYINLVKSGETSGKLDEVLIKMADSLEKDREFRAQIKGAMIYPIVVLTMMLGVVILMMVFVIPKLTSLYTESTMDLPLPTKILIGSSTFFVKFWWVILMLVVAIVTAIKKWKKTPEGGLAFDGLLLKIPIIGKIITNVTLTNFNRTFSLLVSAGIPLLESINIVEGVTTNLVYKKALKASYAGVERGLNFSDQISSLPIFPKIVSQMIKVGEETGKLDEIFEKLANYFETESGHMVKNLTVVIEPLVLVLLGLGVAFLVIAIILPIYKLTTSF